MSQPLWTVRLSSVLQSYLGNLELILQGVFLSSLACLGRDEQVDEEKGGKESSKKNCKVGSELNFKGQGSGRKSLNDGVHCEGRGGKSSNWDCSGSLYEGSLCNLWHLVWCEGHCGGNKGEKGNDLEGLHCCRCYLVL
mmetsp:Transcript_90737/g.261462  ORF Transcript_90737/g.261462 Transcript_90737/m.261462 type:complete len:138 (+) Transcript_90737:83-496(+)